VVVRPVAAAVVFRLDVIHMVAKKVHMVVTDLHHRRHLPRMVPHLHQVMVLLRRHPMALLPVTVRLLLLRRLMVVMVHLPLHMGVVAMEVVVHGEDQKVPNGPPRTKLVCPYGVSF